MRRSLSNSSSSALVTPPISEMHVPKSAKQQVRLGSNSGVSSPFLPHRTQLPPWFHSSPPVTNPRPCCSSPRKIGFFGIFVVVFLCLCLYAFSLINGVGFSTRFQKARNKGYTIIIDAGSSGSRVHVFQYINEGRLPVVGLMGDEDWSLKTRPGLSSYATNPTEAGNSLSNLIEFAKKKVPIKEWLKTKLYLMATAGLRRLEVDVQEAILDSCCEILRNSGFRFRDEWASVITGTDEGVFAWVAANYALGTLGGNPEDTTGIIELGGASAQVTFVPELPPPPEFLQALDLGGVTYTLYTHSFLHFGQEAAWDGLLQLILSGSTQPSFTSVENGVVVDPCTPKGFIMNSEELARLSTAFLDSRQIKVSSILSAGNFSECQKAALNLLQKGRDECLYQRCPVGSTFVPDLRGKFFATENFFYTSQFFGLMPKASLADIKAAGEQFCEEDWIKLQETYKGIETEDLLKYCFSSAYIVALLHDSLGISMHDERVWFTNQVGNFPLDWAMGALIARMEEGTLPETPVEQDGNTILSCLGISVVIGLIIFLIQHWRRKRTKTIYDLEKGRYITTIVRTIK
eukprot:c27696_g1_i1 orf=367-2088(+)